jgi:hypothetical protein
MNYNGYFDGVEDVYFWVVWRMEKLWDDWTIWVFNVDMYIGVDNLRMSIFREDSAKLSTESLFIY